MSDTSATSVSLATPSSTKRWGRDDVTADLLDEEEDMESGGWCYRQRPSSATSAPKSSTRFWTASADKSTLLQSVRRGQLVRASAIGMRTSPWRTACCWTTKDGAQQDTLATSKALKACPQHGHVSAQRSKRRGDRAGLVQASGGDAPEAGVLQREKERGWGRQAPVKATPRDALISLQRLPPAPAAIQHQPG